MTYAYAFSRAWRRLHVFASSSDWFIGLSASLVIGQSDYFGFRFTTQGRVVGRTISANPGLAFNKKKPWISASLNRGQTREIFKS